MSGLGVRERVRAHARTEMGRARRTAARMSIALGILLLAAGPAGAGTLYTWAGGPGPAPWTTAANWRPTRTSPESTDVLVIDTTAILTGIPEQKIAELHVTGGQDVEFQAAASVFLTIAGGASAHDFEVTSGTTLNVDSAGVIRILLEGAATGFVQGRINVSGAAHRILGNSGASLIVASGGTIASARKPMTRLGVFR